MQQPKRPHWRSDIQGLRAVALLALLAYHGGVSAVSGGFVAVDTFFVISGFLITQNLLRDRAKYGRIHLKRFYTNRIVRLAPPAIATIAITLIASYLILTPLDRIGVLSHALSALFGVENINLARTGVDYLAPHVPSMFQQFWSLGIEEQFYLGWALTLAAVCAVPKFRKHLFSVALFGTVASFVVMLVSMNISGPWTYFGVHTRAWEFGPGILLAIALDRGAHFPARLAGSRAFRFLPYATAPLGLAMVLVSFFAFDKVTTPHPSAFTLLPILGAMFIVMPGPANDPFRRFLGWGPMRWLGDRSYSFYLWHWPVIEIPTLALGRKLEPLEVVLALAVVFVLATATYALLERRVANWGRKGPARWTVFVAATAVVAVAAVPLTHIPNLTGPDRVPAATRDVVLAGPVAPASIPSNLTPKLQDALDSVAPTYGDGCHADPEDTVPTACSYGEGDKGTIVLFGDSHAAQWFTPVRAAAEARGMRLVNMTKSACPSPTLAVTSENLGREYRECDTWRTAALAKIAELQPELVIVAGSPAEYAGLWKGSGDFPKAWSNAVAKTLGAIAETTDARMLVMHDTPRWAEAPNRCLSRSIDDVAHCAEPAEDLLSPELTAAEDDAAATVSATTVDPVPWICDGTCSPVLWNVLAYRDTNHITESLAKALTPRIDTAVGQALAD